MNSVSETMAQRYGKPRGGKSGRKPIIALAVSLLVLFLSWAIWVSIEGANQIKTQDLGYEILNENQATVRFSVQSPAGPAVCAIQVLNQGFSVVGFKQLEIPESGEYETTVNTTGLGVSGLVDKCWLK
jgi:hypothetical protein